MESGATRIRTPDQRIRVFVSSTLKELEPERRAARSAIEQLQLAPVMFELGARPHPPRELYRSYLAQSDIFVGIYGDSYGWVAPAEDISGLEDEYRLSAGLPSLIYVRESAARDDRLQALLAQVRDDDRSSYKSFATPDELTELLRADLATLLAERFDASRPRVATAASRPPAREIPAPYTALIGRDEERAEVGQLLRDPEVRIVTIVGPGGIGKSRLAIEIATDAAASGREVAFALLETIASPDRVIVAIARALGVRDAEGEGTLEDRVVAAVEDRDVLLVVDNMEHLLPSAQLLVRLITHAPRLTLLITSRSPLRVRAQRVFELGPLRLPRAAAGVAEAAQASAVALFAQRANAVRPGFSLNADNVAAVIAICRAVDGVPLAIELAAARVRSLSVAEILARLDSALTLLVSGARDLPERQRALRRTIQWSVDLLDPVARDALGALSVFAGSFVFESAEKVLAATGVDDPLTALESLVDASLVGTQERRGVTMFRLLSLVRAYAGELRGPDALSAAAQAWIEVYVELARDAAPGLRGPAQLDWIARLERESENLAAVFRELLARDELDRAADYLWSLYLFLWIGGYLGSVRQWMTELMERASRTGVPLAARTRAIAEYYTNAPRFWQDLDFDVVPGMTRSRDLFHESGDAFGAALARISIGLAQLSRRPPDLAGAQSELTASLDGFADVGGDTWGKAMAHIMLGRIEMARGDLDAATGHYERSLTHATEQGERLGIVIARNSRGWARLLAGDVPGADDDFAHALDLSLALGHDEGIAYGLEAFAGLRAVQGDAGAAGRLVGAAQTLRRRRGFLNPGAFEFYMIPLGALREAGRGDEIDRAVAEGRELTVGEALEHVRD